MAAKPKKLTDDEKWLVSEFRCDLSKVDKDDQDGGKNRDQFLKNVALFRTNWEKIDRFFDKLAKEKFEEKERKQSQADMIANFKKSQSSAKSGKISKAFAYEIMCINSMRELAESLIGKGAQMAIAPKGRNYRVIGGVAMRGLGAKGAAAPDITGKSR